MVNPRYKGLSLTEALERLESDGYVWAAKRLSGNDTGLTGGHQAGVYLPRRFFEESIPDVNNTTVKDPRVPVPNYFPQYDEEANDLKAIYYNSKYFPELGLKKKYDEFRLTGWGGKQSPSQCDTNTGCVFLFAVRSTGGEYDSLSFIGESQEEALLEEYVGSPVEPGIFYYSDYSDRSGEDEIEFPSSWLTEFPKGKEIYEQVVKHLPRDQWTKGIDKLLLARRDFEFKLFGVLEQAHVMPVISSGFASLDDFLKVAHSVANRRKSRSGTSLELNLETIFKEEDLRFETQQVTELKKKPDFLFPSGKAYHNPGFETSLLKMLGAKTCCKDRWRQVLTEANKIEHKHLFTLQQGVSSAQLQEMKNEKLHLVVPKPHIDSFPKEWRKEILSLEGFVDLVRKDQTTSSGVN